MFLFHDHNAGQNHNMKIGDKSFESVTEFKYLGAAQKKKIRIAFMKKIKSKVNSGNVCYTSVQNLLSDLVAAPLFKPSFSNL